MLKCDNEILMDYTLIFIDFIRLIVGLLILSYASYTDIKTRKASNKLWIIMGVIGLILLVIQYFISGFNNIFYILFIPIMIIFVYSV